jgi:hypothetical protein
LGLYVAKKKVIQYWKRTRQEMIQMQMMIHMNHYLAYKREMDQLMEANTITSEVEEDDSTTFINEGRTKSNDEEESTMPKTLSLEKCHNR